MLIQIMTLFPEMFAGPFGFSILKRAQEQKLVEFRFLNYRDYATDKHRTVDDAPYGGGCGMVLKPEPIYHCLQTAKASGPIPKVILLSPQGIPFQQQVARDLSREEHLIVICGHYEGFDERIRSWADLELSLGDFVLTGGEVAAMAICDAVTRLIPGVLGSDDSARYDSFSNDLLDYPHYTRPEEFAGLSVPEILLSGHHARIEAWRRKEALLRTARRRPELLDRIVLSEQDLATLRQELHKEL
ncbi:MAG: tRNA (guanosine(37)-N1)-methyltransferase TrmD [Bacillota bacterium]|jgi:tRNA (guanine37-N1)-methyltransferase